MTEKVNKNDVAEFESAKQIETKLKVHEHCAQVDLFGDELLPKDTRQRQRNPLYRAQEIYKHQLRKAAKIRVETDKRPFTMIFEEFDAVLDWLFDNSKRPAKECGRVWSKMCGNMVPSTGQVALTREEIAEISGVKKDNVSTIINELARIRAVFIEYEKQEGVRYKRALYFINPRCCQNGRLLSVEELEKAEALNLEQADAAKKARKEGKRLLKVLNGEKTFKAFCWVGLFTSSFDLLNCLHASGVI